MTTVQSTTKIPARLSTGRGLLDIGPLQAPSIVLLHSLGLDHRMWGTVAKMLAGDFRVIAPDLLGHGSLATASAMTSITAAADDVKELLTEAGLSSVALVGISMGGAVAQELALRWPDMVRALALLATMPKGVPPFADRAAAAEASGLSAQIPITLDRWFGRARVESNDPVVQYARDILDRVDVASWASAWRALAGHDATERLQELSIPVICMAGSEDNSTPPSLLASIAERIPNARLEVIAGAPHLFNMTHPKRVGDLLASVAQSEIV